MKKKKLPLGIEDFETVKRDCYYVDKTRILRTIASAPSSRVFFFIRPRRFGKSLTLSMIDAFFDQNRESYSLFADTEIGQDDETMGKRNSLPVIRLNLKGLESPTYEEFLSATSFLLSESFCRLFSKEQRLYFAEEDVPLVQKILDGTTEEAVLRKGLYLLCKCTYFVFGKKALVLIDEYDSPSLHAHAQGYYERVQQFFKRFYGDALKGNPYLEKGVITGITQLAHSSIFSDLNNPIVDNVLNSMEAEAFGFTEEECAALLSYYDCPVPLEEVAKWYGGYYFNGKIVWNPWSVLSFVNRGFRFALYWTATGENEMLMRSIRYLGQEARETLSRLTQGEVVVSPVEEKLSMDQPDRLTAIYGLLVFSGYLVAIATLPETVSLRIPNQEIRLGFQQDILSCFAKGNDMALLSAFRFAIIEGDARRIEGILSDYLLTTLSYYDFSNEKAYQTMVLTLAAIMFADAEVKSEVNAGEGRCDILIRANDGRFGAIIEIKSLKGRQGGDAISASAQNALKQIRRKNYAEELKRNGTKKAFLYGMAFQKKNVRVFSEPLD